MAVFRSEHSDGMAEISESKPTSRSGDANATQRLQPNTLVNGYLLEHLPIYRELCELRRQGWQNEAGDTHFQQQRQRADNADDKGKVVFFKMMRAIGLELDRATSALTIQGGGNSQPAILDLCMAPGGFSAAALYRNPSALVRGISLPPSQGGHEMLLREASTTDSDAQVYVSFRDITLLAGEMGTSASNIPASHPEATSFSFDRPFLEQKFDLVFCDGQVLRTHERLEYREKREASRLLTAQLVLALQRIREGGTMVILLHKADVWRSVSLMYTFATFSDSVELFKPQKPHALRSSFYLIAKGVGPELDAALESVRRWKEIWTTATFGLGGTGEDGSGDEESEVGQSGEHADEKVRAVLQEFGPKLVKIVEPVFSIQAKALKNAPWMKK
ncbi:uncharacterized protein B0T15DRAFT_442103 [Chaetomium strumarium]|uniref:Ribosomal RNA methyltransferase FtsJ domain-containing protein n=1 Tax=Chaetomium strumarium TaxID=1170767 RepID=A0AAJ0GL08_9PEZI|nr:hypothetical protein B0T15DRAFT_442103 [Chaetomium strumarium]